MKKILSIILVISLMISSCGVIKPGEVGVKQKFGKLKGDVQTQGLVILNPLFELVKIPTRTVNKSEAQFTFKRGFKCCWKFLFYIILMKM